MRVKRCIGLMLVVWSGAVLGYSADNDDEDFNIHGNLTRMAVERSEMTNTTLLKKLGIPEVKIDLLSELELDLESKEFRDRSVNFFPNSEGNDMTIYQLLPFGAHFEDTLDLFPPFTSPSSNPEIGRLRVFNHFYDPQNNGIPLTIKGVEAGRPSLQWAIDDKDVISSVDLPLLGYIASYRQHFSYANARDYYYEALTNTDAAERKRHFGLTFQTLGHVVHHFQDMAQPQHVRNDTPYRRPRYET